MKRFALLLFLCAGSAFAADHRDGPLATSDPAADLNDVYTFNNPNNANEFIVALTYVPLATAYSQFSDVVDYNLFIDNGRAGGARQITCRFAAAGTYTCTGAGLTASGTVGNIVNGTGGMRVFAGVRDDPFFFDLVAFNSTRAAPPALRFRNPGVNFFANANTLAIVLGLPKALFTDSGAGNVLRIYATTVRQGGDGISAGSSGTWYNTAQAGHGFTVHVLRQNGVRVLEAYWKVYDTSGRQRWVVGSGPIVGNSASISAFTTSGGGFPPVFNAGSVVLTPFGTLNFTFTGCNAGSVTFASTLPEFNNSGTLALTRLTQVDGVACTFFERGQIDREGRPAINTALVDVLASTGKKDAYNRAVSFADWQTFRAEFEANLAALDTLDGATNAVAPPAALASIFLDDRLQIDVSIPACDAYLAVELGVAGQCGGRTFARDVIDDSLRALIGPSVIDNVPNDNPPFLADFPFMSPAN